MARTSSLRRMGLIPNMRTAGPMLVVSRIELVDVATSYGSTTVGVPALARSMGTVRPMPVHAISASFERDEPRRTFGVRHLS